MFWSQPKQDFAEFDERWYTHCGILVLLLYQNFVLYNVSHIQNMLCQLIPHISLMKKYMRKVESKSMKEDYVMSATHHLNQFMCIQ
jgi:hypothetical protein